MTESNIDETCKAGEKAPLGTFVSSNPEINYGLSVWCAMLSSYESGWDKIEIESPDTSSADETTPSADEKPGTVIKTMNFDKMTTFAEDVDFNFSNYSSEHVNLSSKYDHTTGNGQSLEMKNRVDSTARVNLIGMFDEDMRGRAVRVTAWVYVPGQSAEIRLSSYTPTSYGIENASVYCPADTWTQITFVHKHTDSEVSLLGISQLPNKDVATVIYIDDITLTDITDSVEMPELDIQVKHNGEILSFDNLLPYFVGDEIMLPMADILDSLQCITDISGNCITIIRGDDEVILNVGDNKATVNGETVTLKQRVQSVDGVIVIPAELLSCGLGMEVNYNDKNNILEITSEQKNVISIYRNYKKQEIYGFGASISPCAYGLMTMDDEELQKEILDALFGNTGKSAALSLLRMTIIPLTAEERKNNGVNSGGGTINPSEDVWDFDTYDPQNWVADQALSYNPDITFMASIWSPPAWMKTNKSVIGQTSEENKLAKEHYEDYATYLATWANLYKNVYGYDLRFISVQNEPCINAWYDSCLWSSTELATITDMVVDKLEEMGVNDVLVGAPEGSSIQESYGMMSGLVDSKIGFIPTHAYGGDIYTISAYDLSEFGLPVIQTEFNVSYKESRKYTIVEGLKTANSIANCLNNGYNGYLYWYGQAHMSGSRPTSSESLIDWNPNGTVLYSYDFYVMAQFSRYFRPGDHIVISYSENEDIVVVSSVSATTDKVSTIVINNGMQAVDMKVNGLTGYVDVYATDNNHEFDFLCSATQEDMENYTFGARSVTLLTEVDASSVENPEVTTENSGTTETTKTTTTLDPNETGDTTNPSKNETNKLLPVVIVVSAVVVLAVIVIAIAIKKQKKGK